MYKSIEVAWYMLKEAKKIGIELTPLQLNRLVYIAHGFFLAFTLKPLIIEPVEAWKYGAVIRNLQLFYKNCGSNKIHIKDSRLKTVVDGDKIAEEVIQYVLKTYGNYNALTLVNWTSQPDSPSTKIFDSRTEMFVKIDNDSIKNHYRKVIADPDSVSGL